MTDYIIKEKGEEVISDRHQKDYQREEKQETTSEETETTEEETETTEEDKESGNEDEIKNYVWGDNVYSKKDFVFNQLLK